MSQRIRAVNEVTHHTQHGCGCIARRTLWGQGETIGPTHIQIDYSRHDVRPMFPSTLWSKDNKPREIDLSQRSQSRGDGCHIGR
jgi:hypothetical protein